MKIKSLKNYGIPSYILDIWEKHYSPCLLPVQEEAVKEYGVLDCGENKEGRMQYAPTGGIDSRLRGNDPGEIRFHGASIKASMGLPRSCATRNDRKGMDSRVRGNDRKDLLVIAPPSSGKTFIGEMAAIAQAIHQRKIIYLVPFRSLVEEKYRHFKDLYSNCGIDMAISTRDRREDDHRILRGTYKMAVMAYEKFNYFLLQYPHFLDDISLVIIDEMQMINSPKWGPLLREILEQLLQRNLATLKIIALSAFVEEQKALLKWFPAQSLISHKPPLELRKGMVRKGIFKYITSKKKNICQKEVFFKTESVRDNCFEDYLLETVRYLVNQDEPTLIFFANCADTRKWSRWLACRLESPAASSAIEELKEMEETLSREELLELLEKGIAYHNQDLSWEERNLVETYLKKGEIKIVCATNTLAMGINLPFKNVILALDKMHNDNEDYLSNYRTSLSLADIENMGARAGNILNVENIGKSRKSIQNKDEFGRVIFLAYSLVSETVYQDIYSNFYKNGNNHDKSLPCLHKIYKTAENIAPHSGSFCNYDVIGNRLYLDRENDLLTFLLRLTVNYHFKPKEIKKYLKENGFFSLQNQIRSIDSIDSIDEKINNYLNILKENRLIKDNKRGILSPITNGILIIAKRIKVETYLFLRDWIKCSNKGEVGDLEILLLLSLSKDGKKLPIPFPQFYYNNDYKRHRHYSYQKKVYWNRLIQLAYEQDSESGSGRDNEEGAITLENHLAFRKTLLLYDWIKGSREIETKAIEQEYGLYRGAIYRLGEGFSWLADSLAEIAGNEGWGEGREKDLNKIKILSNRLIEGIEEEGLNLVKLYIPGLSRYYIRKLLGAGYNNKQCLKELSEENLSKIIPERLVKRIKKRFPAESCKVKERGLDDSRNLKANTLLALPCNSDPHTLNTNGQPLTADSSCTSQPKTENRELKTVLQIDILRPDRIIFEGKEVKVTATEFSLIHLLALNNGRVMSYDELVVELWGDNENAIYSRVSYHFSKIRSTILKTIGKSKKNKEKVKNVFKVISRRGIMLNLAKNKLNII